MFSFRYSLAGIFLLSATPLIAAPITQGAPGAVSVEDFRIMTESEIAEYKKKMLSLSGTSREDYRNKEYQKLKQRALAQGFKLPDTPPWGRTEVLPAVTSQVAENNSKTTETSPTQATPPVETTEQAAEATPVDMPALIKQQQDVVEKAITQLQEKNQQQPANEDDTADQNTTIAKHNAAMNKTLTEYRQTMRKRFDDFMAEREARQAEAAKKQEEAMARLELQRQQQIAIQQRYQQRYPAPRPQYRYARPPQPQMRQPVRPVYPAPRPVPRPFPPQRYWPPQPQQR